jgi:hypothetical protein
MESDLRGSIRGLSFELLLCGFSGCRPDTNELTFDLGKISNDRKLH